MLMRPMLLHTVTLVLSLAATRIHKAMSPRSKSKLRISAGSTVAVIVAVAMVSRSTGSRNRSRRAGCWILKLFFPCVFKNCSLFREHRTQALIQNKQDYPVKKAARMGGCESCASSRRKEVIPLSWSVLFGYLQVRAVAIPVVIALFVLFDSCACLDI